MIPYRVGRKLKLSKAFLSDPHRSLIEADVGECTGRREGLGEGRGRGGGGEGKGRGGIGGGGRGVGGDRWKKHTNDGTVPSESLTLLPLPPPSLPSFPLSLTFSMCLTFA